MHVVSTLFARNERIPGSRRSKTAFAGFSAVFLSIITWPPAKAEPLNLLSDDILNAKILAWVKANPSAIADALKTAQLEQSSKPDQNLSAKLAAKPTQDLEPDWAPRLGTPNGKFKLVVFYSPTCPACRAAEATLSQLARRPEIEIILRPIPVIQPTLAHKLMALELSAYHLAPKSAERVHTMIMTTTFADLARPGFVENELTQQIASTIGQSPSALADYAASETTKTTIENSLTFVKEIGMRSTPTLFTNGAAFLGLPKPEILERALFGNSAVAAK